MSLAKRFTDIVRCWRELARLGSTTDVEKLVDFAFAHTIAPFQVRSEITRLASVVADIKPNNALELGTCGGGTLFLFCRLAAPESTVISIDLPRGQFGAGYRAFRIPLYKRFAQPRQSLRLLRADSHSPGTVESVKGILHGEPLDFLFIDGDHTYSGVKTDFEVYSPLVRKGGAIAFHDIVPHPQGYGGDVPRFWNEIKRQYSFNEFIANPNGGYGIGLLYV